MGEYWWWRTSGSDSSELCSIWQHILKEKCAPGGRKAMSIGADIFTAFVIFIYIFFMVCSSWCRNLKFPLQVFSCSGHVPAANYMEPSLLIGHNFGEKSLLTKTGILLWVNALFLILMGTQGELIWKHLWLRRLNVRSNTGSKAKPQLCHTVPSPAKTEVCFKKPHMLRGWKLRKH